MPKLEKGVVAEFSDYNLATGERPSDTLFVYFSLGKKADLSRDRRFISLKGALLAKIEIDPNKVHTTQEVLAKIRTHMAQREKKTR